MPKTLPALCCGAWWRQRWQEVLRPRLPLALVSTGLSMLFTHYLFLVNGYTGPDGLCEGLLWATNLNWNIRLGRWLMAWSREASLSLVLPAIFFAANTVAIALAVLLLADLWKVKGRAFVVWGCIAFAVAPAVVWQALVVHLALCFALAMLLAVAAVYLAWTGPDLLSGALAVLCMACSLGGYQAYVGIAAGLTLLTLMLACLRTEPLRPVLARVGAMLGVGVLGGILYFGVVKLEQLHYGTTMADYCGADQISTGKSLSLLVPSLQHAYSDFFLYCRMETGHIGEAFWLLLVASALFVVLWRLRALLRHPAHLALLVASAVLLPLAFNVIDVIATDVRVDRLMSYPMQLLLPFCFALWTLPETITLRRTRRAAATLLMAAVCWLFALSANATYRTVELSYHYVGSLTDAILNQVLADPAYTADTKLLMAGFPDESRVQASNGLYWYSQYQRSPLFWGGTHGILDCWPTYLYDYHGIDTHGVTLEEYENIVGSQEFAAMPVWPAQGSIAPFGDTLVVKLQQDPPQ